MKGPSGPAHGGKKVLADHKKIGKRFIPPLLQLGKFEDAKWAEEIIPEVIWIAFLHLHCGIVKGTALALKIATAANQLRPADGKKTLFAVASRLGELDEEERKTVLRSLDQATELPLVQEALESLGALYPTFPISFLAAGVAKPDTAKSVALVRGILDYLFDRRTKEAVQVQATVIYIAFVTEMLKVQPGMSLAEFPEVEKYPTTEKSNRVAAAVRASVSTFFAVEGASKWSREFWNRGLELLPCELVSGQRDEK